MLLKPICELFIMNFIYIAIVFCLKFSFVFTVEIELRNIITIHKANNKMSLHERVLTLLVHSVLDNYLRCMYESCPIQGHS